MCRWLCALLGHGRTASEDANREGWRRVTCLRCHDVWLEAYAGLSLGWRRIV